jgi:hypothetical protein
MINSYNHLRHVLIGELAELVLEVGLLLLEILKALLSFFKLVAHLDLGGTSFVELGSLLVKLLLNSLEIFLGGFEGL